MRSPFSTVRYARSARALRRLVDADWYLRRYPDVAAAGWDAAAHFLAHGMDEGRDPNPIFDTGWIRATYPEAGDLRGRTALAYLRRGPGTALRPHLLFDPVWYRASYPDVEAQGAHPLLHFIAFGAAEGRRPCLLFDTGWVAQRHDCRGRNPLAHFIEYGAAERISPNPLFDSAWYLDTYPDVAASGINPLIHYILSGAAEGRDPSPHFDTDYYLERNPDVARAGINPLEHYLSSGGTEGRAPSARFDGAAYLKAHPDVAAAGFNPLVHYLLHGEAEGRTAVPAAGGSSAAIAAAADRYEAAGDLAAATLLRQECDGLAAQLDYFAPRRPLNLYVAPHRTLNPTLNILLPSLQARHATGGPNTAYILGALLARAGVRVAFVATDLPTDPEEGSLRRHIARLCGFDISGLDIEIRDGSDRRTALAIGEADVFLATAWWTAHMAAAATRLTVASRFVYLIQDYETLFYGASENFADAEASYALDHVPVINTSLLRDHLAAAGIGRFADPAFAGAAAVFEPAVDRSHFYRREATPPGERILLFYARPTVGRRNLFGLGVAALRAAVRAGLFGDGGWRFLGIGEAFEPVPLGRGFALEPAPWLDFEGYAAQMRGADVLLSLMLSPHPSYPPLEMAACGGEVVTTAFGVKTAERLAALSPRIAGAAPEIPALVAALSRAVAAPRETGADSPPLALPGSWPESLAGVLPRCLETLRALGIDPALARPALPAPVAVVRNDPALPGAPPDYVAAALRRAADRPPVAVDGLFSLLTTVYDTDPAYLADLAATVLGQSGRPDFEWILLDNGSSDAGTRAILTEIARDPRVRLDRVATNLGIVGGMRRCLERARNRYVLPVDSDDLLFADALVTLGAFLARSGFPPLAYTDEDKTDGRRHLDAYAKPDWDPVLFAHSCYIAHLTAMDRALALRLDCYGDRSAEGCHDWDSFMRFAAAGHVPAHLPEVLYSWRIHPASTSGDYRSKPYIFESHRAVLSRFLQARGCADRYEVAMAPLFGGAPDYRFRPRPDAAAPDAEPSTAAPTAAALAAALAAAPQARLVQVRDPALTGTEALGAEEAQALFDLFPDTAIVGGRIHDGRTVLEGAIMLGTGGADRSEAGRALSDPGYFAQSWKPRSADAVPLRHCWIDAAFLRGALPSVPGDLSPAALGLWLCALARERGRRVVCSPYVAAQAPAAAAEPAPQERARLALRFGAAAGAGPRPPVGEELALRAAAQPAAPGPAPLSILTTVYARTDAALLRETAAAVRRQSMPPLEWIVLAHGPVPEAVTAVLEAEAAAPGAPVRVLREPVNLGIHGGLRRCLDVARGDFVLPLDADDLLADDALALIAQAIAADPEADLFYSDEALLVDGVPCHPFRRPGFDPALLLAHSSIWHAIAFRRLKGLELGVYGDGATEYAQDWDTLLRFHVAGLRPRHIPEILYLWRQHPRSLSHGGAVFDGSLRSVAAALGAVRDRLAPRPELCEVAPYPIELGAPSLGLLRRPGNAPRTVLVVLGEGEGEGPATGFPIAARRRAADLGGLAEALRGLEADLVLLAGAGLQTVAAEGLWQAVKQGELLGEACFAVTGPVVGPDGRIARGPLAAAGVGRLEDLAAGGRYGDPGPFSLLALPHCVAAPTADLVLCAPAALASALAQAPGWIGPGALGLAIGAQAAREGRRVVYEPALRGDAADLRRLVADPVAGLNRSLAADAALAVGPGPHGAVRMHPA